LVHFLRKEKITQAITLPEAVVTRLSERDLAKCVIGLDSDHGYWREERIYRLYDGEWMFSIDSHRGSSERIWKLPQETVVSRSIIT
jgi:hypothetical protein